MPALTAAFRSLLPLAALMVINGYAVDLRSVRHELAAVPVSARLQIELKLAQIAQFAGLTPPPSPTFLRLQGIDPAEVFRFESGGYRVHYEVDVDGLTVRALAVQAAMPAQACG
jgi:hypothetical protein